MMHCALPHCNCKLLICGHARRSLLSASVHHDFDDMSAQYTRAFCTEIVMPLGYVIDLRMCWHSPADSIVIFVLPASRGDLFQILAEWHCPPDFFA